MKMEIAALYDVNVRTINEHIKKIYSDAELEEDSTIRNFRIVQEEGSRQVTRNTKHYNIQMIIAVGFKVNSDRAVQFRKWVNQIVKSDMNVAKNYLSEKEMYSLERIVSASWFTHYLQILFKKL